MEMAEVMCVLAVNRGCGGSLMFDLISPVSVLISINNHL